MLLSQESSLILNSFVRNGAVDTVLHPFSAPLVSTLLSYAIDKRGQHKQCPHTFEPWEHPKSTRWLAHSYNASLQPQMSDYYMFELARFPVPKGQVGYVTNIDQVVSDINGNYYPSNQEYWGSPTFIFADVLNLRWYLTLDYYDGSDPGRFYVASAAPFGPEILPGAPYTDMFEIDALWYPVHANHPEMKLIVPGQRMLRFFFYTAPTTVYHWEARGRLSGYTQSTYSAEAMANARRLV